LAWTRIDDDGPRARYDRALQTERHSVARFGAKRGSRSLTMAGSRRFLAHSRSPRSRRTSAMYANGKHRRSEGHLRGVGVAGSNPVTPTIDFLHVFLLPTDAKPPLVTSISVAWSQIWSQLGPRKFVFYRAARINTGHRPVAAKRSNQSCCPSRLRRHGCTATDMLAGAIQSKTNQKFPPRRASPRQPIPSNLHQWTTSAELGWYVRPTKKLTRALCPRVGSPI
jgi:hypothetical protein